MVKMTKEYRDIYPNLAIFLKTKLADVAKDKEVFKPFRTLSKLNKDAAKTVVSYPSFPILVPGDAGSNENGLPNRGLYSRKRPKVIVLAEDIAANFEKDPDNPDQQKLIEAVVLHETVHWALEYNGEHEDGEKGEQFEMQAYGRLLMRVVPFPSGGGAVSTTTQPGIGGGTEGDIDNPAADLLPGRPSIRLEQGGKVAVGTDGLVIEYRGDDGCLYGRSATANRKKFHGLVVHHTSPKHDTDWYIDYQIRGDATRGGHFGYHFYISPDGRVFQGAPLTKRTNHVSPKSSVRRSFGAAIQNTNSIGISCVGAGQSKFDPTQAQVDVVKILAFALADLYDFAFSNVVGHGEVQTNRMQSEGAFLAKDIRSW